MLGRMLNKVTYIVNDSEYWRLNVTHHESLIIWVLCWNIYKNLKKCRVQLHYISYVLLKENGENVL